MKETWGRINDKTIWRGAPWQANIWGSHGKQPADDLMTGPGESPEIHLVVPVGIAAMFLFVMLGAAPMRADAKRGVL